MDRQQQSWDDYYKVPKDRQPDEWLKAFEPHFFAQMKVLDLGCGDGSNIDYLLGITNNIDACDYSAEAISKVIRDFGIRAVILDIRDSLPYPDRYFDMVLADLSLHYFSESETREILKELSRILKNKAILLVRINSTNDINHGYGKGVEIEKNFFEYDGRRKRFFDRDMIELQFKAHFSLDVCREAVTGKYKEEKFLWEILLVKRA